MNIMVFDVPAESGGALTILNEYYNNAVRDNDRNKKWYFVVSLANLAETENVKILRFPWIKKSWLHRLFFDTFIAPRIVHKYETDKILSLQNVIISNVNKHQTLYLHNSLPFINKRFGLLESPLFWIYQNLIGKKIIESVRKADQVIVQTQWMKHACVERAMIPSEKVTVIPPTVNIEIRRYFQPNEEHFRTFFYPASGFKYKNHSIIVEAALLLKKQGINNYKIIFTLLPQENKYIAKLYEQCRKNDLPVEFIGTISRQQVFDYYHRSILLFPSYIETFGLPMLEAKLHHTPVIASDMSFSHEILDGYERVFFFCPDNPILLADHMRRKINDH